MAVDSTDITNLLKNVDINSLLGGDKMTTDTGFGGGTLGAVLIGALLPRLLGNGLDGVGTASAVAAQHVLTASDVQNIVNGNTNSQTLGNLEGEIWKAEGQLQGQLLAQSNTQQITTLNAEIANLQGQSGILASIANNAKDITNEVHVTGDVVNGSVQTLAAATAASFGVVNTNIAQNAYATAQVVVSDGEKTRGAIALLAATLPNARELDLQRQLTVALDDHRHTQTRGIIDSGNTNVTTNVNQATAQSQQQQQLQAINTTLASLVPYVQNIGQSVVNLGTMVASPTAATNVRA